jgi:hypothetical protein
MTAVGLDGFQAELLQLFIRDLNSLWRLVRQYPGEVGRLRENEQQL